MSQENGNNRKQQEGRSGGQSVVLYLIAAAVGVSLLVMWVVKSSTYVISYQHLLQLVEANQKTVDGDGTIEVLEQRSGDHIDRVRYSNLRHIRVGDRTIRGVVDIEKLTDPLPKKNPALNVKFRTYKSDSDTVEAEFIALLKSSTHRLVQRPRAESLAGLYAHADLHRCADPVLHHHDAATGRCRLADAVWTESGKAVRHGGSWASRLMTWRESTKRLRKFERSSISCAHRKSTNGLAGGSPRACCW